MDERDVMDEERMRREPEESVQGTAPGQDGTGRFSAHAYEDGFFGADIDETIYGMESGWDDGDPEEEALPEDEEMPPREARGDRDDGPPYPVIMIGALFIALFLGMVAYIGWYAYTNRERLMSNSYNARQKVYLAQNIRGSILSSDGQILAATVTDEAGNETRVYPYGPLFAHAVGYATRGRAGIEAYANYYLIRSDLPIREKMGYDAQGLKIPGNQVVATLDSRIQEAAARALGIYRGAVIVSEVATGRILAMSSGPSFDPGTIEQDWERLIATDENTELLNRATQGVYPPGSTFKIVTALAYLKEHGADVGGYTYNCYGSFTTAGETIHCFHGEQHGTLDFVSSFARSCNSSFANIGLHLNRSTWRQTLKKLGFNAPLDTTLLTSRSRTADPMTISEGDLMQLSIGQGATGMTPLHLNMITAAIANDGVMMEPYLIDRVEDAAGGSVRGYAPARIGRVMSEEEAQTLRYLMTQVVETGTGGGLRGLSYTAAGKTGSAEYNTMTTDSHAWFTGFAPAEQPEIAITVVIENAGSGGSYAVPVARQVLDAYFSR